MPTTTIGLQDRKSLLSIGERQLQVPKIWACLADHGREARHVMSDACGHAGERFGDDDLEEAEHVVVVFSDVSGVDVFAALAAVDG